MMRNAEATKCYRCRATVEAGEGFVGKTNLGTAIVNHVVCPPRTKTATPAATAAPVAAPATPTTPVATVPMATDKQVSYALSLAARNAAGSLDVTADTLRRMTRRDISALIDSLRSEW